MVTIILGEQNDINYYAIENILNKYKRALTYKSFSLKKLETTINNISKPIVPIRALLFIQINKKSKESVRNDFFVNILSTLSKYKNHKYLDIVVHIEKVVGLKEVYTDLNVIRLDRNHKQIMYNHIYALISKTFYRYTEDNKNELTKLLCTRLKYSSKNFSKYKDLIFSQTEINPSWILKNIKIEKSIDLIGITYKIILGKKSGVKEYYTACERYSRKWVNKEIKKILSRTISYKIKIYTKGSNLGFILNDNEKYKYRNLVMETSLGRCYQLFLLFSQTKMPIEKYIDTIQQERVETQW